MDDACLFFLSVLLQMTEQTYDTNNIIVIKVGTSTLMDPTTQLPSVRNMGNIVESVVELRRLGYKVVFITSGAVGFGCKALGLKKRPPTLPGKQAMAAIGQSELMRSYRTMFEMLGTHCAQLLITRTDLVHRSRYMNFRNALHELLKYNVVPIINENDAVATEELRFGNNDSLAAHVAVLCEAQWLFLLTDVDCLYTSDPRTNPNAKAIAFVPSLEELAVDTGNEAGGTSWGTGGMATKLVAAQISTAAGVNTVLANGAHPHRVFEIINNSLVKTASTLKLEESPVYPFLVENNFKNFGALPWPGTIFKGKNLVQNALDESGLQNDANSASPTGDATGSPLVTSQICSMKPRKRWILSLPVQGKIVVDNGAAKAIMQGNSLLAVGVAHVRGQFLRDQAVAIFAHSTAVAPSNSTRHLRQFSNSEFNNGGGSDTGHTSHLVQIAHCIVTMGSEQLKLAKGKKGKELSNALDYEADPEVAHRQDIVLMVEKSKN